MKGYIMDKRSTSTTNSVQALKFDGDNVITGIITTDELLESSVTSVITAASSRNVSEKEAAWAITKTRKGRNK